MKAYTMRPSLAMKKPKYAIWDDAGNIRLVALKDSLVTAEGYLVTGKDLLSSAVFNKALIPMPSMALIEYAFVSDKHDAKQIALDMIERQKQRRLAELDKYVLNRVTRIQNVR